MTDAVETETEGNALDSCAPRGSGRSSHERQRDVGRRHLVNRLNYLNFKDDCIIVNLAHLKYGSTLSLRARPLPCLEDHLECVWVQSPGLELTLRTHRFVNFIVPDTEQPLLVQATLVAMTEEGISFRLPDTCQEIRTRKIIRHGCSGVQVQFIQNGAVFHGNLMDFSPVSFRVEVTSVPPQSFQWINPEPPVHIVFSREGEILYSGDCRIIKQNCGQRKRSYVLSPLQTEIRRFKPKQFRSTRHRLVPSPNIVFTDPLTGRVVNLKAVDVSGSGFSVEECEENSVLLPGRVIPELHLDLAGIITITCRAQVVYRKNMGPGGGRRSVRCGLAILDADVRDHIRLLALLHQAADENSYVCNRLDLDSLWNLFFQTGFVYPEKYLFIEANKNIFKKTYERLYSENPHIARHFVYQSNGAILGHMAMIRLYRNTWLIHHHAAHKAHSLRAGMTVLSQIGRSINDSHNLYSAHMNFACCYYRPENRFPSHVFGAFSEHLRDPKGCSVDSLAYFHYMRNGECDHWELSGAWKLSKTESRDLAELESFYNHVSNGLMIHALDLESGVPTGHDELEGEYARLGFRKERRIFSLKRGEYLKAVFLVNISDIGLNLSDLTNSITAIIMDGEELPRGTLFSILSFLSKYFEYDNIPILLYPVEYADSVRIPYQKVYNLWILNIQEAGADYLKFMNRFQRHAG